MFSLIFHILLHYQIIIYKINFLYNFSLIIILFNNDVSAFYICKNIK